MSREKILEALKDGPMARKELAVAVGLSDYAAKKPLAGLERDGLVQKCRREDGAIVYTQTNRR